MRFCVFKKIYNYLYLKYKNEKSMNKDFNDLAVYYIENNLDMNELYDLEDQIENIEDDIECDSDGPTRKSRILKIHHNMYSVDTSIEKSDNNVVIDIDENFREYNTNFVNLELEQDFHEIVSTSKYSTILDRWDFNKELFIEFFDFCISKLYPKYSVNNIFLYLCNYYDITNISGLYKNLPLNIRNKILSELKEYTTEKLNIEEGLF